jgi:spermidine synthase
MADELGSQQSPRQLRLAFSGVVMVLGIQAIVSQSLLIREALVLMFGSEVAWGVVLTAWLLGVALGGVFAGRWEPRPERQDLALVATLIALSTAVIVDIWVFRGARGWLGAGPGELLPLSTTVWSALVFVTPASLWVGVAFPLASRLGERIDHNSRTGSGPLGRVYALESLGSLLGGAWFSFWAIENYAPVVVALLCSAVTLIASAVLLWLTSRRTLASSFLVVAAVASFVLILVGGETIHQRLIELRWRHLASGYELVAEFDSKYQNLAVGQLEEQYTLYADGQVTSDFPDPYTYAPLAHFWMSQHPAPRRVLMLAGGAEGLLAEVLLHPVERVDVVEPDPRQLEITEPFLATPDREALEDERVHLHHLDGRFFIKTQENLYDLVIARLPEPTSALRARYFTTEFYRELRRAMTPQSVLCLTAAASPGSLTPSSAEYLASLRATIQTHFPHVLIGWGQPAHVLASTKDNLTTTNPEVMTSRHVERDVSSEVFHPTWFEGATDWLDPDKVSMRAAELDQTDTARVSTDLHPIAYIQRLVLWDRLTGGRAGGAIERLRDIGWLPLIFGVFFLVALLLTLSRLKIGERTGWAHGAVWVSIATTGFVTMALSIVWLFAFQSLYGYVYQRIGWIIALFMGGLVLGCGFAGRLTRRLRRWLIIVDLLLAILALSAPVVLPALGALQTTPLMLLLVELSVSILVMSTGVLGGAAFALAGGLELAATGRAGKAAGRIVGADHAGACLGALLTGILLVPVHGTVATVLFLGGTKLVSAGLLWKLSFNHGDK